MPRGNRDIHENLIYHVLNRGNGKQKIFHKRYDYDVFIELMRQAKEEYPVKIYAYCLMPNHFHIVIMPLKAKALSNFMQWLMTTHVRRHHKRYDSSGHIWQGRFKSFIVSDDEYLLTLLRYVETNPVRAKLVKLIEDWNWSSYRERKMGNNSKNLIDQIPIELPKDWDNFIAEPIEDKDYLDIKRSIVRGSPFGPQEWRAQICKKLGLEHTLRARGRPVKRG